MITKTFTRLTAAILTGSLTLSPAFSQVTGPTSAEVLHSAQGRIIPFLQCLRDQKVAYVGAHRGGPLPEFPENSTATMERTTQMASIFVETDVQETSDGVLFMNHDDVLPRNTTGTGAIADHTWAEISALRLRDTIGIPSQYHPSTFLEVLNWAKDKALVLIDMKPKTNIDRILAEVDQAKAGDRVMYLAYTVPQAKALLQRRPDAVFAFPMFNAQQLEAAKAAGLPGAQMLAMVEVDQVDPQFVRDVAATGAMIMSGTYGKPGRPDAVYRTSKDAQAYLNLVGLGPQLIVSNRPIEAATSVFGDAAYRARFARCLRR